MDEAHLYALLTMRKIRLFMSYATEPRESLNDKPHSRLKQDFGVEEST